MIRNKEGASVLLRNTYLNQHCFFFGGGPSLLQQDLSFLSKRGILSFAANNVAAKTMKPNIWCGSDDPRSFHEIILDDPTIQKFLPQSMISKPFYRDGKLTTKAVKHCPNLFSFDQQYGYSHEIFLDVDWCYWGCEKGQKCSVNIGGGRSVMYSALKLIYYLGFRFVYLLGCDFKMVHDPAKKGRGLTYAFSQYKWSGGVLTNNSNYNIINRRLTATQPHFLQKGFQIFNCTPNSQLTAFPNMTLEDAIEKATEQLPKKIITGGLYGGKKNLNRWGWSN